MSSRNGHAPGCTFIMTGGFSSDLNKPPRNRQKWTCTADCPIAHPELMVKDILADIGQAVLQKLEAWKTKLEADRVIRREELVEALETHRGNITRVAEALPLARSRVNLLLQQMGLQAFARGLRAKTTKAGRSWRKPPGSRKDE